MLRSSSQNDRPLPGRVNFKRDAVKCSEVAAGEIGHGDDERALKRWDFWQAVETSTGATGIQAEVRGRQK